MNNSKAAIVVSQIIEKIEFIVGVVAVIFWGLCDIMNIVDPIEGMSPVGFEIFLLIMTALNVWLIIKARERKKMRLEFKKYVAHLSVDTSGNIQNLAVATGTSVDVVKKNLNFMIKKKFFPNAYIDVQNDCIVLPSVQQKTQVQAASTINVANVTQKAIEYVTCNCPNCGGINKIEKGATAECDFCGSPLTGK